MSLNNCKTERNTLSSRAVTAFTKLYATFLFHQKKVWDRRSSLHLFMLNLEINTWWAWMFEKHVGVPTHYNAHGDTYILKKLATALMKAPSKGFPPSLISKRKRKCEEHLYAFFQTLFHGVQLNKLIQFAAWGWYFAWVQCKRWAWIITKLGYQYITLLLTIFIC